MTEQPHDEVAAPETVRRQGPWKLIIVVAILTAVGVWLVPSSEDEPELPPIPPMAGKDPGASAPSLLEPGGGSDGGTSEATGTGDAGAPATSATEDSAVNAGAGVSIKSDQPGAMARTLIAEARQAGSVDLQRLYAQARQAQDDGQLADAYMLYFFGSRFGHAESALQLGTQADPATRDPDNSVFEAADLTQAHKWYQVAAQYGSADGAERLRDLRDRVERMAADGDSRAQRTLLLWQ